MSTATRRRRALQVGRALVASLCVLATPSRAGANPEDDKIAWLIAHDRSREALPIALERARGRFDEAAWLEVRKIAGWNSATDAELEALEHLVVIRYGDAEVRFALAQRLLWKKRTAEALPHVRWLAARAEERDPRVLEVCFWVASAEGERDLAYETAKRWLATASTDEHRIFARWGLADLTHWSVRWRDAREQYLQLGVHETQSARAGERLELLRREHPTEAHVETGTAYDNFENAYSYAAVASELQLPWRLVLQPRAEMGRWSRHGVGDVQVATNQMRVRIEAWDAVRPEGSIGLEGDSAGNRAGFGSIGARLAVAGRVFGRIALEHDRLRVGAEAIRRDVRAYGPVYLLYAEITPNVFLSSEGQLSRIDDGNVRTRTVNALGAHTNRQWQLEMRVFAGYDAYQNARVASNPYYTPTDPWAAGWDVAVRGSHRWYRLATTLSPGLTLGFVIGSGTVAVRPAVTIRADVGDHLRFALAGAISGAPAYWQARADATAGYLF